MSIAFSVLAAPNSANDDSNTKILRLQHKAREHRQQMKNVGDVQR